MNPPVSSSTLSSPFFVVDAVPHRSDRFDWISKIGHEYFYMNPWSDLEISKRGSHILHSRLFFGKACTELQLWHLHKESGASPRDLVRYACIPDDYKSLLVREITSADDRRTRREGGQFA